jgi:5-methylcytosine-specific restriction endonuclease McrA
MELLFMKKNASTYKRPKTDHHADIKNLVWSKTHGKCSYCGCEMLPFGGKKNSFTMDHIIPLRNGGINEIDNLLPVCKSCNSKKGAK